LDVFPPADFVMPRVPWIRYREPDAHLDDVVDRLTTGSAAPSRVIGVGPFDEPLIERLVRKGAHADVTNLATIGIRDEFGRYPYLETVQARLPDVGADGSAGDYDLVVCRYVLEHCHQPLAALQGLKRLLAPNGRILVEVPDCDKFLRRCDYSFVWEEHICYFSEATLGELAGHAGLRIGQLLRYEGALEDGLVAVLEKSAEGDRPTRAPRRSSAFPTFVERFPHAREHWRRHLGALASSGKRIALFGVGHQAVMFVNAFGLEEFVTRAADDQIEKQGYFAPGLTCPIISSVELAKDVEVGAWLLAISPGAQDKVRTKFSDLLRQAVEMYSIFPAAEAAQG
jgi:SAM-dependent methyltransferase